MVENEGKLKEMKDHNRNPYDIKKFEEVLGESHMMIPDSKNRLEQALADLGSYVESTEVKNLSDEIEDDEWYVKAQELLEKQNMERQAEENDHDDKVEETDVSDLKEGEAF